MKTYILDGKTPVLEPDIIKWAQWYESADRVVGRSNFELVRDGTVVASASVETVFSAIDPTGYGRGKAMFKTVVVWHKPSHHPNDFYCCDDSWDEAEENHRKFCASAFPVFR